MVRILNYNNSIVYLLVAFPAINIIGIFPTVKLAQLCEIDVRKMPNIVNTCILEIPLDYTDDWRKLLQFILQHFTCDVCGGITQCHCKYFGLTNYSVNIRLKHYQCVLEKNTHTE